MESLHLHTSTDKQNVNNGKMELNGNCTVSSESTEDLSEYTDADESLSAPIEILAEFLSAVMLKDYEKALKYCKIILQYEPNHSTAKEFYPLIQEKLMQETKLGLENRNEGEDSASSSDSEVSDERNEETGEDDGDEEEGVSEEDSGGVDSSGRTSSRPQSDSDATSASYSSLEDEEAGGGLPKIVIEKHDNDFALNGNNTPTTDSESPTEPVSQRLDPIFPVAI